MAWIRAGAAGATVLAAAALALAHSGSSEAAFPGKDGRIFFDAKLHGSSEIYSIQPSGSGLKALTHTRAPDHDPAVGPAGKRIVYYSQSFSQITTIGTDGKQRHQLTHTPAATFNVDPSYAPSGKRIVYVFKREPSTGKPDELLTIDANGGGHARRLDDGSLVFIADPVYDAAGQRIVFVGSTLTASGLWAVDPNGAHLQQLTTNGADGDPSFAPNGQRIAFSENNRIMTMRADGSGKRPLGVSGIEPAFSPSGKRIAFMRFKRSHGDIVFSLWTMRADGGGVHLVRGGLPYDNLAQGIDWGVSP